MSALGTHAELDRRFPVEAEWERVSHGRDGECLGVLEVVARGEVFIEVRCSGCGQEWAAPVASRTTEEDARW